MSHPALELMLKVGRQCRARASAVLHELPLSERIAISKENASDVIYRLDHEVEWVITKIFENEAASIGGIILIAEGIGENERTVYPQGMDEAEAQWQVLMDPVDGTRCLMYDKRSGFFLAGVARNDKATPCLSDIECAVMVELPTSKAFSGDVLWAIRGSGAQGESENLITGEKKDFHFNAGLHQSIHGGFAQINRFCSPGRDDLARLEEALMEELFPEAKDGEVLTFEDQYICSGGQLYEMMRGNDRFIAELRATLYKNRKKKNLRVGLGTHPYDLAGLLIAEEAGLVITDIHGEALDAPFDTTTEVDFVAYANPKIFDEVNPAFQQLLVEHGFITEA